MSIRLTALALPLLAATALAQTLQSVTTRPLEPAEGDLSRLNLVAAWRLYAPVEGRHDGIATIQAFDDEVFIQLHSGRVVAVQNWDNPRRFRKAGDVLWSFRPARPPGLVRPLAVSPTEVYLIQGQQVLLLDRSDGKLKFAEEMVSSGQDAPAVDNYALYIPLANRRVVAYSHTAKIPGYRPAKPYEAPDPITRVTLTPDPADALSTPQNRSPSIAPLEIMRPPFRRSAETIDSSVSIGMLRTLRPPYREIDAARSPSVGLLPTLRNVDELTDKEAATRIKFLWELVTHARVLHTPVLSVDAADPASERLHIATGRLILTARRSSERVNNIDAIYGAEAEISAPLTSYGDNLYVATEDANLIALSIREIREPATGANTLPRGKFTTGGPIEQEMLLTDEAVYAIGSRWGLIKLRHGSLEPFWTERLPDGRVRPKPNEDVIRLVGVNSSYVYGINRRGHLVVVDAIRGQTLSSFDVSAFTVPVTNEANDRVFLAANNGLVVALHDRARLRGEPLIKPAPKAKPAGDGPVEPEAPKKDPEKK